MIFSSKKIGQPLLLGFNAPFRICIQFDGVLQQIETFICGIPVGNYMFKVNNRNSRTRCDINFEHISHLVLSFLLLTLSR